MIFRFHITRELVNGFAELTGDFSSIHMDAEFARKSRYRAPVAHGMLAVGYLGFLPSEIKTLKVRFLKPFFIGIQYEMHCSIENDAFKVKWQDAAGTTLLAEGTGTLVKTQTGIVADSKKIVPFLTKKLAEANHTIESIVKQETKISFDCGKEQIESIKGLLQNALFDCKESTPHFSQDVAMSVMLSTLVGMQLPGRSATFTDFEITFDKNTQGHTHLAAQVASVFAASQRVKLNFEFISEGTTIAFGSAGSLVTKQSENTMQCEEIKNSVLPLGLKGKVALVVGASRGIGNATAKLLAMNGAKTVLHYFQGETEANQAARDIKANGGEAITVQCDVREESSVEKMFSQIRSNWGEVDVLVNCSVFDFNPEEVSDLSWRDFLAELEVTLHGTHTLCKQVLPVMKEKRAGKIIHLSSVVTDVPVSGQNRYITAKSALEGYTKSLAVELAPFGVQVNTVVPGMTETSLLAKLPPALVRKISEEKPTGKILQPMEVAQTILFLASNWSKNISGQRIVVNGAEGPFL